MTAEYLTKLVRELRQLPRETEWVEFKTNNQNPHEIGKYISAMANAAALGSRNKAYVLWGIDDPTHSVVGTYFSPAATKRGNELLEPWLLRAISPHAVFCFHEVKIDGRSVVILEIDKASWAPVAFKEEEYIRVSSTNRRLRDYPEKTRALWKILSQAQFEDGVAIEQVSNDDILSFLDYSTYFDLRKIPLPDGHVAILDALQRERMIKKCDAGGFDITNLGALLFATNLDSFPQLQRKAVRVIQYDGTNRNKTLREQEGMKGYACGFEGLVGYVNARLPANEHVGVALRESVPMFPELAIRELVANALIHQDFFVTGAGPMVEIFDDRIEITNPGRPLVDPERFLDTPPRSRNETLASLMRRFGMCEERGSGIDKVVSLIEIFQLPAPLFQTPPDSTQAVLFAHKPLAAMEKSERIRACYLHACLRYVTNQPMTNASLRARFGIEAQNASIASRLLGEAVEAGRIVIVDAEVGTRARRYFPFWAATDSKEVP